MDQTERAEGTDLDGTTNTVKLTLATRSTELRSLTTDCSLRWFLDQTQAEDEGPLFSYYALGTSAHAGIEVLSLDHDLDPHDVITDLQHTLHVQLVDTDREVVYTKARPDCVAVLQALEELVWNWYHMAHPNSDKRHPFYRGLKFPPQAEVYMEDTEHQIYSTADAIFEVDEAALSSTHAIVDYKSGMGRTADSLQLWFYYYIGRKQGVIPPDAPFLGVFHHLTHNSLQWAAPYPGDSTMDAMLSRARAIKTGGHWIPEKGWYCSYCPWQNTHCPLFTDKELDEVVGAYSVVIE